MNPRKLLFIIICACAVFILNLQIQGILRTYCVGGVPNFMSELIIYSFAQGAVVAVVVYSYVLSALKKGATAK